MELPEYDLTEDELEQIDSELSEKIGIEIEHEPYLAGRFEGLMMETEA